jgi:acetyl/propionyl-CoA carboxylase alpha subunit
MLAKLVTYGQTRGEAIQRMREAIAQYEVEGVATTLPFGRFVMDHPAFLSGQFDTHFVKQYFSPETLNASMEPAAAMAAKVALALHLEHKKKISVIAN